MGISRGGNSWLDPDKLPDAGEMPPMGEDATRMDLASGPKGIEGGTHIIEGGTEEFQVAMNNDKPTSLMRSGGGGGGRSSLDNRIPASRICSRNGQQWKP